MSGERPQEDFTLPFRRRFYLILTIDSIIGYCSVNNRLIVLQAIVVNFVGNFVFLAPCSEMPEFGPVLMRPGPRELTRISPFRRYCIDDIKS